MQVILTPKVFFKRFTKNTLSFLRTMEEGSIFYSCKIILPPGIVSGLSMGESRGSGLTIVSSGTLSSSSRRLYARLKKIKLIIRFSRNMNAQKRSTPKRLKNI